MTNRKIKLLFFHDHLELGGGEKILLNILHNLDKNKFDFSLVLSEKKGVFLNDANDIDIIDIKKIKSEKLIWRFFRYVERFYKVYKMINLKKPDIVITFSTTLAPMVAFTKLFVRREKVIIGLHIFKPFENCFLGSVLTKLSYLIADKIIPVSNGIAEDLNKNFNVPKDKISIIHNGIDIEWINKLKDEKIDEGLFKKGSIKILSCGRLAEGKGHIYLIKAFKIVKESGINANLILLGTGPLKEDLENIVRTLRFENDIMLPGFKSNPYKYMKNSDIFVLSSLSEAFSCVIIEAMTCGVPVIATHCGGPTEIITDGVNGILVPINDEKAMANAIIELLMDKERAKKISEEGIKRANDFGVKKMVREYEKTFVECYYNDNSVNYNKDKL